MPVAAPGASGLVHGEQTFSDKSELTTIPLGL